MKRTALYTGSFDPVTYGHLDIMRQACRMVEKLVVAVGVHSSKTPVFTPEERMEILSETVVSLATAAQIEIVTFDNLAISAARKHGASVIVRGVRDGTDLDYEMQMAAMNATMAPEVQTVFFPASPQVRPITATLVRQIAAMGGDVSQFVPPSVAIRLKQKFKRS